MRYTTTVATPDIMLASGVRNVNVFSSRLQLFSSTRSHRTTTMLVAFARMHRNSTIRGTSRLTNGRSMVGAAGAADSMRWSLEVLLITKHRPIISVRCARSSAIHSTIFNRYFLSSTIPSMTVPWSLAKSKQHHKVHAPRNIACTACDRTFTCISATVLHQEENACPDGMSLSFINQLAKVCGSTKTYLVADPATRGFPYQCYGCLTGFRSMGALLQHAESNSCGMALTDENVKKFCEVVAKRA